MCMHAQASDSVRSNILLTAPRPMAVRGRRSHDEYCTGRIALGTSLVSES